MISVASPTSLYSIPVWSFLEGSFQSDVLAVPIGAKTLHFHFLPLKPAFGPPIQLRDGFTMSVHIELVDGTFLIGTKWTSYGQHGITVPGPDGHPIINPGAILNLPSPGDGVLLRAVALSDSVPQISVSVLWL